MSRITFEREIRKARLLNPLRDFKLDSQPIEFRKDPLTDRWSRLNIRRARREKQTQTEIKELSEIIEESKKDCFFCPRNLERKTPKFPEEFPARRIRIGSARIFPNLFPFGEFHAIGIFSQKHYLELNRFSPKMIKDCLEASLIYLKQISEKEPDAKYCTINWNHLPPAGASFIHPHLQILADYKPTSNIEELIRKSEDYYNRNGSNYWSNLRETEKREEDRFIGERGTVTWMTSFSPQGNNEVLGIFDGISSLSQMNKSHLWDFSVGLSKVLKGYNKRGTTSFNMSTFSGPNDRDLSKYYLLNIKILTRPGFKSHYTSDDGFMEKLHNETVVETQPEDLALELKKRFEK